jgi:hypothetical protein
MPTFCLSFALKDDHDRKERRYTLMKAVQAVQMRFWDRTGDFALFETTHTLDFLGNKFRQAIDPKRDLFVLIEIGSGRSLVCGETTDQDVFQILPGARALG